jgi:hypothetical protein
LILDLTLLEKLSTLVDASSKIGGFLAYTTFWHECGHAAHFANIEFNF